MVSGAVLLGHGSKDPAGTAEFLGYVEAIRARAGGIVTAGVLEYPTTALPDIQTAFERALAQGADELVALPVLLFFAGHMRNDVPEQVARARARHPGVSIRLAGPLGVQLELVEAVEERLAGFEPTGDTAVLLVARGSLHEEANADLFKLARLLWGRNRFGWVESCFISVAPPFLPDGLARCARLGARRAIVVPYFLNTGVLVKRVAAQAHHPTMDVALTAHLGVHEKVIELLVQRLVQAAGGLCACRSALPCRMADTVLPGGSGLLACAAPASGAAHTGPL